MNVESQIDGGCERFLNIDVFPTEKKLDFAPSCMDPKGRKKAKAVEPYTSLRGIVKALWINRSARDDCKADQEKRHRWKRVLKNAKLLKGGSLPPPPVFLDPSLTGTDLYRNIDGARRIMSMAEVNHIELECVILKKMG